MNELDELVNDEPEVNEPVEQPDPEAQAQEESPPEVKAEEPPVEPASTDKTESETVPIAAVLDERRKRQELERQLAQFQQQQAEQNKPQRPDVFEDQDGYSNYLANSFEQRLMQQTVGLSRDMMQSQHEDYAEMEAEFVQMAQQDPRLTQEMLSHANPARFAYETARKAREYREMQNVDEYKSKLTASLRDEIKAELLAEMKADNEKAQATDKVVNMPNLAATTAATGGFATPTDEDLADIMGR